MARKDQLRSQRSGTVINSTSKNQETNLIKSLKKIDIYLSNKFPSLKLIHRKLWYLKDIVKDLEKNYSAVDFSYHFETTSIKPDGGFLCISDKENHNLIYPILISEVKHQGTNDQRKREGKKRQARGNAIERLGKNLIGLRTALMKESIFPFVCFGYGCDFERESSILDRVSTMAMFGKLNKTYLHNSEDGKINRGSFYFREKAWEVDEMVKIMKDIAERSVFYYFSKYGEERFTCEIKD